MASKFNPETPLNEAFSKNDANAIKSIVISYFYQIKKKY